MTLYCNNQKAEQFSDLGELIKKNKKILQPNIFNGIFLNYQKQFKKKKTLIIL